MHIRSSTQSKGCPSLRARADVDESVYTSRLVRGPNILDSLPVLRDRDEEVPGQESANAQPVEDDVDQVAGVPGWGHHACHQQVASTVAHAGEIVMLDTALFSAGQRKRNIPEKE